MALNIADLFEHAADLVPDRVALICGPHRVGYAELEGNANRLAHHLREHGVEPGQHVGVQCQNSIEAVTAMLAAYKLRAVAINVNYRYVENELRYLYENADLVALVHDRRYTDRVAPVLADTPNLKHVIVLADDSDTDVPDGHGVDYAEALAAHQPNRDFGERSDRDTYVLYTGGTTGMPKGVLWRHADVWRALGGGIDFMSGEPLPDEWAQSRAGKDYALVRLCLPPLIHGAAQWSVLPALFACGTVVLMPRFDPAAVWRAIEENGVNVVTMVGDAMARPLIEAFEAGRYNVSTLAAMSSHAALFSPAVQQRILAALPNLVLTDAIGSSEGGFNGIQVITKDGVRPGGPRVKPGRDVIVIDERNQPVPAGSGQVGRVGRGGHIPYGYYKDPVKTAELFVEVDGKHYAVPGDYARMETDGSMTLLGRGNVSVNTGGEKVFPEEVEGALKSHPDVFDALVIGVPDERLGQRVGAVVQPREGVDAPDLTALSGHVRTQLAGYKVPRALWIVDQIGRSPSGKPDYRWAVEHAAANEGSYEN
ncbi:acyl-CoA synthetase [Pseudonocardia eucalypti]|uniref:Acyl-CoA synthetase n=1 Tax=Pseudonocardia eucalypti TaxID=648755 RepID=A0ABP9QY59_9PSEU|nr:acyl-CoA synthetase (AMP-forming)/AMP-acid ligase II [Pseudonocardia eucalypti]